MQQTFEHRGRRWTPANLATLRTLSVEGGSYDDAVRELARPRDAIRQKAKELGVTLSRTRQRG